MGPKITLVLTFALLVMAAVVIWSPGDSPGQDLAVKVGAEMVVVDADVGIEPMTPRGIHPAQDVKGPQPKKAGIGQHPESELEGEASTLISKVERLKATFIVNLEVHGFGGLPATGAEYNGQLSWRDHNNAIFEQSFGIVLDKEGQAEIEFPIEVRTAKAGILTIKRPRPPGNFVPQLHLGICYLLSGDFAEREPHWVVDYATDVLLAGRVVDETGKPYAQCLLALQILDGHDDSKYKRLFQEWTLTVDQQGRFEIHAQRLVQGLTYELRQSSPAGVFRGASPIAFTAGREDVDLEVERIPNFVGRILVDDPDFLSMLTLVISEGPPGWSGGSSWNVNINTATGEFETMQVEGSYATLTLYCSTTQERISMLTGLRRRGKLEDGKWKLPDWNFQGRLFRHHLEVVVPKGKPLKWIHLSNIAKGKDRSIPKIFSFLSTRASVPMTLSADGFRDQEIVVEGETSVTLISGFALELTFAPPLPEIDGVQWKVCLQDKLAPKKAGDIVWLEVEGKQAILSVQATGKWDVYLRAAPASEAANTGWDDQKGIAATSFPGQTFTIQEEGSRFTLSTDEDELAQAIAELGNLGE